MFERNASACTEWGFSVRSVLPELPLQYQIQVFEPESKVAKHQDNGHVKNVSYGPGGQTHNSQRLGRFCFCLSACLSTCMSACRPPVCLPDCLPVCLPVCLSACLPACVPACLPTCPPVRLSVCPLVSNVVVLRVCELSDEETEQSITFTELGSVRFAQGPGVVMHAAVQAAVTRKC